MLASVSSDVYHAVMEISNLREFWGWEEHHSEATLSPQSSLSLTLQVRTTFYESHCVTLSWASQL